MPYAHRTIHDADAHFMETPTWFHDFADPDVRDKLPHNLYSESGIAMTSRGGEGCRILYNEIENVGHCGVKTDLQRFGRGRFALKLFVR